MCSINQLEYYELSKSMEGAIITKYDLEGLVDRYTKELHNDRQLNQETNLQLFHSVFQPLKEAVKEGFGQVITKVEYGTPNFEMLKNLQHNAGVFAIFKNHAMVKEIVSLLKDDNGDIKPYSQFRRDALKIDEKYRQQWLKTEYDTAVRTSRMAAQWERIQRTKHLYPNLEYVQTKAATPDVNHLQYVGIIRPVDDPFWASHYPPNRFNCQCSVRQTDKDVTDIPDGLPELPKEFAFNSGITGQALNIKDSEYIKSASKAEIPKLIKMANTEVNKDIIKDIEYQQYYKSKAGGKVEVHPLASNNSDFQDVLNTARSIANSGNSIKILPDLEDAALRTMLLPLSKIKGIKNPDYLINSSFVADLKIINGNTQTTIHNAIKRCNEQCDNIIMVIPEANDISLNDVFRYTKGKISYKEYAAFEKVWINYKGKWYYKTREEILKDRLP